MARHRSRREGRQRPGDGRPGGRALAAAVEELHNSNSSAMRAYAVAVTHESAASDALAKAQVKYFAILAREGEAESVEIFHQ